MSLRQQLRRMTSKLAFGDTLLPQEFTIGLTEPEAEISVWLCDRGKRRDVTGQFTTACTSPLTLCISLGKGEPPDESSPESIALHFCERDGKQRLLGEIQLACDTTISVDGHHFMLFRVRDSTNYCLPRIRLWAHYALHAYSQWRRDDPPDIRMTLLEQKAASVTFIRPHPLCLVSVGDLADGNIFPMNLMGDLGDGYFGFALREQRLAGHLVERAGRIALSAIPISKCSVPFRLVDNHKKTSIDWSVLPFETKLSGKFGIPVPSFAVRVREMQVERVHPIGSHRFFIARVVSDETHSSDPQACVIHGFYQFLRLGGNSSKLKASITEDIVNKKGSLPV
jgi:hypothetical protein